MRLLLATTVAAAVLFSAAPASADPAPADPGGVAPAAPAVDTGKVASAPPATMTASDGVTLTVWGEEESQQPVPALTTAITTRDYDVDGIFRGSIDGSSAPTKGLFEVGYQIGCGIDMGTGPGVLIGGNLGANLVWGFAGPLVPGADWGFIPNAGLIGGGSVTVSLKPGIVNTVPVTKKQFQGEAPRVAIRDFRVKIDGCVGESFIRSYAVLFRVTDERDTVLAWYGETKRV